MPPSRSRSRSSSRKRSKTGSRSKRPVWSNSVGTRYETSRWVNPTMGEGKTLWNNRTANTAEANACLSVALNAFSDATMQPRFPDGKASESVGMKYQMINEIEFTDKGTMEIIFFAGLNCCAAVRNCTSKSLGQTGSAANIAKTKIQRITNHVTGPVLKSGAQQVTMTQENERHVAKWRGVSYGMLLSLVNNSEENDGWWEACRITPSSDVNEYGCVLSPTGALGGTITTGITQPFDVYPVVPELTSSEMLNQASYCTGKLRNIHNVIFQLNPEYDERDFCDLAKVTTLQTEPLAIAETNPLDAENPPTGGGAFEAAKFAPNARIQDDSVDQFRDGSFDNIFIRIHGVDGSNGRSPSRLTMHSVMNQEIVYDEKALNAKFHQGSVLHTKHESIRGAMAAGQPANIMMKSKVYN